ncbi:unnamed protein product [Caenorhabditis nigoni]
MIRVSSSKWMLLALLSVMLTTNSADTAFEAEIGHPDVQFSENFMEGVRLARAAPKTTKKKENPTTVNNPPITVTVTDINSNNAKGNGTGNGGGGGVTVPTQPPRAAANSGVEPSTSTTEPPPVTNMTTNATEPTTVETTNATTETTPTTAKTTEPIILTTKAPSEVPNTMDVWKNCEKEAPINKFDQCVDLQLSCKKMTSPCDASVVAAVKSAAHEIYDLNSCSDLDCAGKQKEKIKKALKTEANFRCKQGDNSCDLEAEKTLAELTDCSKPTTQSLPRCLPKKTVPTPAPPTPEAPKSTDIHKRCKDYKDVDSFDMCAKDQILVPCPSTTPSCDSAVVDAAKKAAREINTYKNCPDLECAKNRSASLSSALEEEENARCRNGYKNSCNKEWEKTLNGLKDCSSDPAPSRCIHKSLDIFESCQNDKPYADCVDQQLDCQQPCSKLAENSRTAALLIYHYDKCDDVGCAAGKKQQLEDALNKESIARCKDSQCLQDWKDWLIKFTDCSLHPGASRCKPATTTTTPAAPTTTETPVTVILPNNNPSSTSSSPVTNSTQVAPNTTTSSIASQTPAVPVFPPGGSAQTSTSSSTDEQDPGTEEYVPPHEDLPEDFSCQNLGEKYKACEYLCKQLASLKPYEDPGIDWRFLPGAFMTAGSLLAIPILFVLTKRMTNELAALNQQTPTAADDPNAKLKIAYAAALDVKDPKNPEKKEEKSQEVPSPPSLKNNPAAQKMRAKLLETQQNLQKLRTHAKKCVEEHKKDAASSKFQKKGAIYIPNEPEIPPPAPLPDNIILDNVEWCSDYNEMYVIGSDVDDIELDQDYVMNPDSFTTDDDEDKSKKSQKSKNSKKSKKSAKSKKSKKDVPSTSGAPSAAPPASTTSAPSTSTPSADAKRESNQNKSKEQQ